MVSVPPISTGIESVRSSIKNEIQEDIEPEHNDETFPRVKSEDDAHMENSFEDNSHLGVESVKNETCEEEIPWASEHVDSSKVSKEKAQQPSEKSSSDKTTPSVIEAKVNQKLDEFLPKILVSKPALPWNLDKLSGNTTVIETPNEFPGSSEAYEMTDPSLSEIFKLGPSSKPGMSKVSPSDIKKVKNAE